MPSTVIKFYHYSPATAELTIGFVSGNVYKYQDVPEEVYLMMKHSFSKGIFFNTYIRDRYNFEKTS